jgi:hypothetical protein
MWMQAMRAAIHRLRDPNVTAVIAAGTATSEFVLRGTERQESRRLFVHSSHTSADIEEPREAAPRRTDRHTDLRPAGSWADAAVLADVTDVAQTPLRDRAAIAWADEVIVLSLRTRGNLHTLLRARLHQPSACVLLADLPGLQSRQAQTELVELGAGLFPVPSTFGRRSNREGEDHATATAGVRVAPLVSLDSAAYLSHTTRACTGPWPGQSRADYLDSLLDGRPDAARSPLQTLIRIVEQRRLIASSRAIRGGFGVVSFTEVPLHDLPELHVFRAHRARWDFEPYGISIRRDWMEDRGARRVTYAGNSDWQEMPAADRPYFQHVRTGKLDWTVEREWRHPGDLELTELAPSDAFLFAPSVDDARMLLAISPWPVTVLGASSQ